MTVREPVAEADGSVPDVGLGVLLREADFAFNRVLRRKLAAHGITFSQFQHLRHLWDQDGLSQTELSRRIGIERASSTLVIDALDKAGLIRRERDRGDGRKLTVFLTEAGAALRPDLWACARETNARAREGLSDAEVATVFRCLSRMVRNLEIAEPAEP
jgi:DNA-binding MarR family transcriptional regulator